MKIKTLLLTVSLISLSGCAATSQLLNPFYEPPQPVALLGEANDNALREGGDKQNAAREALQAMASYQRAHEPSPVKPVMQPAVVRMMWVPDHLNRNGDLVPAHYYYLKVLSDRWAVSDAFELERQLNGPNAAGNASSSMPFIYDGDEKNNK